MRDILEVEVPSFSLVSVSPSPVLGGTPLPFGDLVGTSSQFVMLVSELPRTPVVDYSNAPNNDFSSTLVDPTDIVVLSDSASLGHLNLPGAEVDSEVHCGVLLTSEVPLVISFGV